MHPTCLTRPPCSQDAFITLEDRYRFTGVRGKCNTNVLSRLPKSDQFSLTDEGFLPIRPFSALALLEVGSFACNCIAARAQGSTLNP